jgi:4-amino-4-deoxy-L-arabinose transferase-like glycosyltransferase
VLLAALGQALLDQRLQPPLAFALCGLGLALAALAGPAEEAPAARPCGRAELSGLAFLTLFALALRLYANGDYPIGISYDESVNGLEARNLLRNPTFPIWSDALSGRPTLHLHLVAAAFGVFGVTPAALRGVSAVVGALTVPAVYLLARQLGGVSVAFAAASFLAISRWHVSYSRLGYEAILGPLCAALAMYFFLRGLRERRWPPFAVSGLALGIGLYGYIAFRLFPLGLVPAGLVALARAARAGGARGARRVALGLAVALLAALLANAPLIGFAATNWNRFAGRFAEVSVLTQVQEKRSFEPLIENTLRHVGMLNYRGGIRAVSNLPEKDPWQPGTAMLGAPFAALFLIGLGRTVRRAGTAGGALLLATLASSLIAGILTRVEEGPHQTRALVAVVVAAYCAGEGLIAALCSLRGWVPRLAPAVPLLVAVTLAGAGYAEGSTYWKQLNHPEAWWDFPGEANAAGRFLRDAPPGARIYVSASLREFPSDAIVEFVSGIDPRSLAVLSPVGDVPARVADGDVVYALTPRDYDAFRWGIGVAYPEASWSVAKDPFDRPLFASLSVPRNVAGATLGLKLLEYADRACSGRPVAERFEPGGPFGAEPPADGVLCRAWQGVVFAPQADRYRFRVEDDVGRGGSLWLDGQEVGEGPVPLARGFVGLRVQRPAQAPAWRLHWARGDAELAAVPADALFSRPELAKGLFAYYYPNPRFQGPPRFIQRDWAFFPNAQVGGPYSISWRGVLVAPVDGEYRFTAGGDEGTQVILDGQLLLDTDVAKNRPSQEKAVRLTQGRHEIELRYFKAQGTGQSLLFQWQPPGRPPERLSAEVLVPSGDPLRDAPRNGVPPPRT